LSEPGLLLADTEYRRCPVCGASASLHHLEAEQLRNLVLEDLAARKRALEEGRIRHISEMARWIERAEAALALRAPKGKVG
jgi:hypothetical protein